MATIGDGTGEDNTARTIMERSPLLPPVAPAIPPDPKGIGAILSEAFALYQKHLVFFIVTAAVVMGPVYLVKDGLAAMFVGGATVAGKSLEGKGDKLEKLSAEAQALGEEIAKKQQAGAPPEEIRALERRQEAVTKEMAEAGVEALAATGGILASLLAMVVGMLLSIPLILIANYLAQAALVVAVADRARGGSFTWQQVWSATMRRIGPLVVTSLIASVIVLAGLVFCLLPGLVAAFLFALASCVVLLEGGSGFDALKRSANLVMGDLVRFLVLFVVFALLKGVASWLGGLLIPDSMVFLDMLVGDLVSVVVAPIPIIGLVLVFDDLQRTKLGVSDETIAKQRAAVLGEAG